MFSKTSFRSFMMLLAVFSMTFILSACSSEITYTTIDQKDLGLTFDRPDDWDDEQVAPGKGYVDYIVNIPGTASSTNQLNGTIGITVVSAPTDTLLNLDEEIKTFKNLFKDAKELKVESEKETTMMGEKAREVVLSFKNSDNEKILEKVVGTAVIHNNKIYMVTFDEEDNEFGEYLPVYTKLRESLHVTGAAQPPAATPSAAATK